MAIPTFRKISQKYRLLRDYLHVELSENVNELLANTGTELILYSKSAFTILAKNFDFIAKLNFQELAFRRKFKYNVTLRT